MIVRPQEIEIKWNSSNKKRLMEYGYNFTGFGSIVYIDVDHLSNSSDTHVLVTCDFCNNNHKIRYADYTRNLERNSGYYYCKTCKYERQKNNSNKKALKFYKQSNLRDYENDLYVINYKNYNTLDEIQEKLINEIIRFCEENKRFPDEKDMTNKNGYISRTQFYKYFKTKRFTDLYDYVFPLKKGTLHEDVVKFQKKNSKPKTFKCSNCEEEKPFNQRYFSKGQASKYGLKTICKVCENKANFNRRYSKKGIYFNKFEDIAPEIWWEYVHNKKIRNLPEFCLTEENIIKIVRYVLLELLNLNKEQILNITKDIMVKFNIYHLYCRYHNKLNFLRICFPDFNIKAYELPTMFYNNEDDIFELISDWIYEKDMRIEYFLNTSLVMLKNHKTKLDRKIDSLLASNDVKSFPDLMIWYFSKANIKHPTFERYIKIYDFKYKHNGFFDSRDNRIGTIKTHCEDNKLNEEILYNNKLLKKWIYNNFKQSEVSKLFNYNDYYDSIFDALVDAYPEILIHKLFFKWEWHQWNYYDHDFLINMLRELVEYRFKIKDFKSLPKYLNPTFMQKNGLNKFNKIISKRKMNNYYEWAIESFPEYKHLWEPEDFNIFYAKDGSICDSKEEVIIYDFIKENITSEIKAIGTEFMGNHTFTIPNSDKWYCPDFVIGEDENRIYIEYFGLYSDTPHNSFIQKYHDKTIRKISYYNKSPFRFIYLYPSDLNNNFEELKKKFEIILNEDNKFPSFVI